MIRVGIVGTGNGFAIAGYHLKAFERIPELKVTAVCTRKREKAEIFVREKQIDADVCDTYEELLQKVDAVCICTPNDLHARMALQALRAEKWILCEKPLFGTKEELQELLELAREKTYGHLVGFNYRYSPENIAIKELVNSGQLGKIYTFYQRKGGNRLANAAVPYEWRMEKAQSGMGAGIDFGCHMVDNFFNISGYGPEMLEYVTVEAETYINQRSDKNGKMHTVDTEDMALIILCMKDGCRAVLDCNRLGLTYEEIQVIGSEGMAIYSGMKPGELHVWRKKEDRNLPAKPEILKLDLGEDTYYLQALAWVNSIKEKRAAAPDLIMGYEQAKIFEKIQAAANKPSVQIK